MGVILDYLFVLLAVAWAIGIFQGFFSREITRGLSDGFKENMFPKKKPESKS